MSAAKTIVITLPKRINPGGRVILPSPSSATTAIASKQLSSILSGNFVQLIKDEPSDSQMDDMEKPPRKRQRLDHLTMEEKIMRRKLKNRVAAQTARDRKKMRMDQLEAQINDLTCHVSELNDLTSVLTEQNSCLAEENAALKEMLSKCSCGQESTDVVDVVVQDSCDDTQNAHVLEGVMIPVDTPADGSAVSQPQPQAVGVSAVVRIMVLSTLCSQWVNTAAMAVLMNTVINNNNSLPAIKPQVRFTQSLPVKKRTSGRWWGAHQQSWNPTGM